MANFAVDISKWVEKTKSDLDTVVRKIALEMFTRVIMRSPVDTGRFRANWQVAIGELPDGVLELTDKDGSATVSAATAKVMELKAGQRISLVNNLPYARRLEYGWSQQAPSGMVRVTVEEFGGVVADAAAQTGGSVGSR